MTRQRAYQLRHRAAGLCLECPNKAVNAKYCEEHRQKDLEQKATAYQRKKARNA